MTKRAWLWLGLVLLLTGAILVPVNCGESGEDPVSLSLPTMKVHFIDVGHGEAILIDCGITEVVIDGGNVGPGVVSYLEGYVDGPIELLVITSPDDNHVGGLIAVLESFEVWSCELTSRRGTSDVYAAFGDALSRNTGSYSTGGGDGTTAVGHNPKLIIEGLNSSYCPGLTVSSPSIVFRLQYGQIRFLFEGDAGQEAEACMLQNEEVTRVDILKVGAHGSRSASSEPFLAAAKPKVAVYSAGAGNSDGCPDPEVTAALEAAGAEVYGTDVNGTVVVSTDGKSFEVITER